MKRRCKLVPELSIIHDNVKFPSVVVHPSADMVTRFLNSPGTKQLYVAKVMNLYLCKQVLKYTPDLT